LKPEFRRLRAKTLARRGGKSVESIVVTFGQVDSLNATMQALTAIELAGFRGQVTVLLGSSAPHLDQVKAQANDRIRVLVDADDVPRLFSEADLSIGAGGVTAWERCCLGLPSVLTAIADNQRATISLIVRAGAADGVQDTLPLEVEIAKKLKILLADSNAREAMSKAGAALEDGRGGERALLAAVESRSARNGASVNLRLAEAFDEAWLLDLQRMPETRHFSNNVSAPTADEHHRWFAKLQNDLNRSRLIIECGGERVGMLRLDDTGEVFRISVAIDPKRHGEGIGGAALELANSLVPGRTLEAEILPGNKASLALFARAGYRNIRESLYQRLSQ
jgi:RimJ/RimL family protein N-acetyltransferase